MGFIMYSDTWSFLGQTSKKSEKVVKNSPTKKGCQAINPWKKVISENKISYRYCIVSNKKNQYRIDVVSDDKTNVSLKGGADQ